MTLGHHFRVGIVVLCRSSCVRHYRRRGNVLVAAKSYALSSMLHVEERPVCVMAHPQFGRDGCSEVVISTSMKNIIVCDLDKGHIVPVPGLSIKRSPSAVSYVIVRLAFGPWVIRDGRCIGHAFRRDLKLSKRECKVPVEDYSHPWPSSSK